MSYTSKGEYCPECGKSACREEADNGVAMIYGPWGCSCGWSEEYSYDQSNPDRRPRSDQWGMIAPKLSEGEASDV